MEKKTSVNLENAFSNSPIPLNNRKTWIGIAAIYFGNTAALSSFSSGGGLIANLTFWQTAVAALIATALLLLIFFIPMGYIGAREGVNTYVIGEAAFGKKGSTLATAFVITIIPCVGWYGVQVSIAASALDHAIGGDTNLLPLFMVVLGVLFAVPAMYGVLSMAWLDYISIPAILVITVLGVVKVLNIAGLDGVFSYVPSDSQSILWGINIMVGSLVVGASFAPDYTRWSRNKLSDVTYSGLLGIAPPLIVLTIVGSMLALTATTLGVEQAWNISEVLSVLGLPVIALLFVILLQWTTNITAAYSAGLALTKTFGWSRFWWTLIAAVVGTALSLFGIINHFLGFLGLLAIFVSPATGVIISEYFFVSRRKFQSRDGVYWPGIAAWLIGGAAAYFIPFFIPAINGVIIAAVVYYVYHMVAGNTAKVENTQEHVS
jgi:cytosine permease